MEAKENHGLFVRKKNQGRAVRNRFFTISGTELDFVRHMDTDERVKYYVKLPGWFSIDTPLGQYNPDWAIMLENERTFYLVRETKSTTSEIARRGTEILKIHAARAHYKAIDVDYDDVTSWGEVVKSLGQD